MVSTCRSSCGSIDPISSFCNTNLFLSFWSTQTIIKDYTKSDFHMEDEHLVASMCWYYIWVSAYHNKIVLSLNLHVFHVHSHLSLGRLQRVGMMLSMFQLLLESQQTILFHGDCDTHFYNNTHPFITKTQAKTSLMSWVVVIAKEGWAREAAPILLLVLQRLF